MRRSPEVTYYCSRPQRLHGGQYRLIVEHQLEIPSSVELKAWDALMRHTPMLSITCSPKRAVSGEVESVSIAQVNRLHVVVKIVVVGRLVSRVCKGAKKSTAANQS